MNTLFPGASAGVDALLASGGALAPGLPGPAAKKTAAKKPAAKKTAAAKKDD